MIEWIHNIRIIVCLLAVGLMMPQHALALEDIQYSQAFSFSNGMKCKSSPTISNEFTRNVHFHMIVGAEHNEAGALLAHRLCHAFQMGIDPSHMHIIVQRADKSRDWRHFSVERAIRDVGIQIAYEWVGSFDPNEKMGKSYAVLANITKLTDIIFHTDLDEFPERRTFEKAYNELMRGDCDAIQGNWADRLSREGALHNVPKVGSIFEKFPYRCDLSNQFVGRSMTYKTLLYRGAFRVDGGQHDVWCDRDGFTRKEKTKMIQQGDWSFRTAGPGKPWSRERACISHIEARNKLEEKDVIMKYLQNVPYRPRYCKTEVILDHFKWIDGIQSYLYRRARNYRRQQLHWWRDSRDILLHLRRHDGHFCVKCSEIHCKDTVNMDRDAPIDPLEIFFSRRDSYGKAVRCREREAHAKNVINLVANNTLGSLKEVERYIRDVTNTPDIVDLDVSSFWDTGKASRKQSK